MNAHAQVRAHDKFVRRAGGFLHLIPLKSRYDDPHFPTHISYRFTPHRGHFCFLNPKGAGGKS